MARLFGCDVPLIVVLCVCAAVHAKPLSPPPAADTSVPDMHDLIFVQAVSAPSARARIHCIQMWRHGDRTPIAPLPNATRANDAHSWSEGIGELSSEGVRQAYELGYWLRQRYTNWLPVEYAHADVRNITVQVCA
jgi:hypothetical protein